MKATVVRNGQHSGGDLFVEVAETPSSPRYAVPVSSELPLGTVVEISVKVAEVPKPEVELEGTDVATGTAAPAAGEEAEDAVDDKKSSRKKGGK